MAVGARAGTLWLALVLCALAPGGGKEGLAQDEANRVVSPDMFGQVVDVVTPGYLHWSRASGDTVDPDADRDDLDDNFGEHAGAVDNPTFSSQAGAYAAGSVAEEAVYAYGANTVRWEFRVPGPGRYVMVTRLWRELREATGAVFSYRSGDRWIGLPAVEEIEHWGGYGNLACFLIEAPAGQDRVPVRLRAISGRCLMHRALLGRAREGEPFLPDARPTHPSMYFRAGDLPGLREKIKAGPAKLACDYMVGQAEWYRNTLNRGDQSWRRENSQHHVSRSIAQTAFLCALTGDRERLDTVLRMIETVMGWPRDANAITDQKAGYNILARGRQLSMIALAYDWLYDRIAARQRRGIARFMDQEANRLFLYNETILSAVSGGNWDPWIGAGYGMVGVALRDEHAWAQDWIDGMKRIFPLNLRTSGEDFGYFNNGFTKALDFGAALRTATGEDLFAPEADRLRALLDYRMTFLAPQRDGYPQFGDARSGNDPVLALCMAAFLEDPMAQWFVNHLSCATAEQVKEWGWNHMMPVAAVTLHAPGLAEEPPGPPRLALARSFANDANLAPGVRGVTVMRTGYDRPTDVQVAFPCGDYTGWHGHPDQGGFVLNAWGDHLVIDRALGAPYGTPRSDFSKSALAHSTVTVDGQGQVDYSAPVYHDLEAGRTGPLLHAPFLDYVLADSTAAYRKNPRIGAMDHARRHFLFVREPERRAYLVLFDDLQVDDRPHAFDWLLQTDQGHAVESAGRNHQVIRGDAELHVFTVEPGRISAQVRDTHDLWRTLTLTAPADARRGLFLNVLYPAAADMAPPAVERLEGPGVVGACVGEDDAFLFATAEGPIEAAGVSTDGRIAAVGRRDGAVEWFLCVEGTRMEVDGREVFRADAPVTLARQPQDTTKGGRE